jgi:methylmalonyl-CoA mutase
MKNLFDDFDPVSSKQWKQKIQFDLDGADYNKSLIWNSPEDIQVKPFYHKDESSAITANDNTTTQFNICQNIFVHDVKKSNLRALNSVKRGAESIRFTIINEAIEVPLLLENIALNKITIYFNLSFLTLEFVEKVSLFTISKQSKIYFNFDPIGHLANDGNWITTSKKASNFESLNEINSFINSKITSDKNFENNYIFGFLSINACLYQNAGANIVQQIAYSMAHANEYFNTLTNLNQPIVFEVSVGSNYFFEIAKLKSMRILFHLIAKEYNHNLDCHIIATPTKRNKTLYDYNVNMLRTTTECMSAVLGGADVICNLPHDLLFKKDNEFSNRISRNQLLILKNESYFDKVENPTTGSYYIESLTSQLIEKSLALFKDIESNGGFLKQLKDGTIKRKIEEAAQKEQELFDSGKEILVGTNKFPNKNEKMKNALELYPFAKIKPRKTLISPIIEKRLAEKIEQERLKLEGE